MNVREPRRGAPGTRALRQRDSRCVAVELLVDRRTAPWSYALRDAPQPSIKVHLNSIFFLP
jgi:hypothetical protein